MKVLHLIDAFDARFERDQIKLVEWLEKKGYENTVITTKYSSDWKSTKRAEFAEWEKRFSRTEVIHAPSLEIPTPFSDMPVHVYLPSRQIQRDFDIIHAYTFATYSSFLGAASRIMKGTKAILRSELSSPAYRRATNAPFYRTILTLPFRIVDAVYAFSILERRYLANLGVDEKKIQVIPVGIDYSKFSKVAVADEDRGISIGYSGRIYAEKGLHRIVAALQKVLNEEKNVSVSFIGAIEDANYAKEVLTPLQKHRNFKYFGYKRNVLPFYELCDVILVPSLAETGAVTVLEAMASGKAVIASNINPIKEYIEHEHTGFLFNNQEEVYLYLKKLLESPNLIREIGRRARKEAAKYDWSRIIHRYEEMYRSVIK